MKKQYICPNSKMVVISPLDLIANSLNGDGDVTGLPGTGNGGYTDGNVGEADARGGLFDWNEDDAEW